MDVSKKERGYKHKEEFVEVEKDPLIDLNSTDSSEFWLIQWPRNQDPNFDGKEVSLKLNAEGNLGSVEGSSGKSYEVVSFDSREAEAMVFSPSASGTKIVGKISRRVSLVHYPEPSEYKKDEEQKVKRKAERATTSMTNTRSSTPMQGMRSRTPAISGYTSSMLTSTDKSLTSGGGERSRPSKKRKQVDGATRSLDQSLQNSGRGHSGVTSTGSDDSRQTSKKQKKSRD